MLLKLFCFSDLHNVCKIKKYYFKENALELINKYSVKIPWRYFLAKNNLAV